MKNLGSLVWGAVLIALGVILGLNALGLTNINVFFPGWWTLFIIIPCAVGLITEKSKGESLVGLVIGVILLLGCLDVISFSMVWRLILPVILVVVGVFLIARNTANAEVAEKIRRAEEARHGKKHEARAEVTEGEIVDEDDEENDDDDENDEDGDDGKEDEWVRNVENYCATFGSQRINYDGKKFVGCRVDVIFGNAELDLRRAKIENEAVVRATSLFGKIMIMVPEGTKVEMVPTSIFGEVKDQRVKKSGGKASKTIYVDAKCIFGGLEIV